MKKGDLSRYVEEAVRWRVFDQTVQAIKERNRDLAPEELDAAIEEALREVRSEMSAGA
jgi:predicted HD phosphohydrolase